MSLVVDGTGMIGGTFAMSPSACHGRATLGAERQPPNHRQRGQKRTQTKVYSKTRPPFM